MCVCACVCVCVRMCVCVCVHDRYRNWSQTNLDVATSKMLLLMIPAEECRNVLITGPTE